MSFIRSATIQDVPSLLPLVEAYWVFEGLPHFDGDRIAEQLTRLLAEPTLGAGWVAYNKNEPIGYLIAVYVFSLEHFGLTAEIDELFVMNGQRGSGIGQALLQAAEQAAAKAGCTNMSLQLSRGNEAAHAFYHRQGYEHRSGFELLDKTITGA